MKFFHFVRRFSFVALAGAIALAAIFLQGTRGLADEATGQAAPAWKLKDLDGRDVDSSQFKGKVVVVDFWATWCGPCLAEIPGYIDMQKKYGDEGLVIVGISVDQKSAADVKKFAASRGINYTIVMADDRVTDDFGGVQVIPTTFLINREGQVVHAKKGAMAHADYEKLVVKALR